MAFVSETTKNILSRAKFSKERTNIENSHPVMAQDLSRLSKMAKVVGINFDETEYSYQVVKKEGDLNVYGACVMANDGVASIFWGKTSVPLASKPDGTEYAIVQDGKQFVLDVFGTDSDGYDVAFQVPLVFKKDLATKPEHADVRAAHRKGELHKFLASSFIKAKKLSELEPGEYTVTGYAIRYWNGDPKVELDVANVGRVNANTYLKNKLLAQPEITEQVPAILEVGISTKVTSGGFPIVPVVLTTQADLDLPVFDFSDPEDTIKAAQLPELIL